MPEMDDQPDLDNDTPPLQDGSVWAQLRHDHEALTEEREPLVLDVPGYSGLRVRYRYFPLSKAEKSAQRIQKVRADTEKALYSAVETLILACDELLVARPTDDRAGDDGYAPLCDPGTPPVRFDHVLAEGMGWPKGLTARQIVRRLFGGEAGDYALIEHAREVQEWMASEREQVAEDFAGK